MPTGYTAKLMSEGQTFQDFVLTCARAMGACISMRDDDNNAKIPAKFTPSKYHVNELARAKKALSNLEKMSNKEKIVFGTKVKNEAIISYQKLDITNKAENKRLIDMRKLVMKWVPPTKDHQQFKDFMLEQLDISMNNSDYYTKEIMELTKKDPIIFWKRAIEEEERNIIYSTKEITEENERIEERNKWINDLRKSLK